MSISATRCATECKPIKRTQHKHTLYMSELTYEDFKQRINIQEVLQRFATCHA